MKVLLIDVNCKYSSTGKIVYDLYNHLNNNGDEAAICYGRGPVVKEKNIYKFGLDWETYLHALLTRITGYTGCFSYFSTKRLIRFIEEFQPDVVHIHELHAYFVNVIPLLEYLKKKNINTIMTLHCEFMYTGKCGHALECEQWKTECKQCSHLRDYPKTLLFDHTNKMFKEKERVFKEWTRIKIITPSKWLADRVSLSFLGEKSINVIHNGINTDVFCYQKSDIIKKEYKIKSDEKVVLALAPNLMSENKGGKQVLKLAQKMCKENIRFVLVGIDGNLEISTDKIVSIGRICNQKLLAQYYSLADVFVICSTKENFPTTCLESLCCGTPIAGYSTGGTAETADYPYGQFVEYGDINGLSKIVLDLLNNALPKKTIEAYGKSKYSIDKMFQSYYALYKSFI